MRLWHEALITVLPTAQLLGQHRECCALRGNGWGRPHSTVNYVFNHERARLVAYHMLVMDEMRRRGYHVAPAWLNPLYRGQHCAPLQEMDAQPPQDHPIYPEHDEFYYAQCIANLMQKNIDLVLPGRELGGPLAE